MSIDLKILILSNRIALVESRGKSSAKLINKLKRQLRALRANSTIG